MPLRTEKEKMLAGESYNCLDPDLEAERQKTKELLRLYNLTEAVPERQTILQQLLGQIGQNSIIEPPFYCRSSQTDSDRGQCVVRGRCHPLARGEDRPECRGGRRGSRHPECSSEYGRGGESGQGD
jgi:hypothetical protein